MKRKMSVVLIFIMLLSFCACRSTDTQDGTSESSAVVTETIIELEIPQANKDDTKECKHIWGQWEETEKPTCDATGKRTRKCVSCSKKETEKIKKLSHTKSDWIIDKVATAEKEGKRHIECSNCKKIIKEEAIPKISSDHKHEGAYSVSSPPTCEQDGVRGLLCSCGATITKNVLKATGHTLVTDNAIWATCAGPGLTEGKHCEKCGKVVIEQMVVPQLEHNFSPWRIIVQPTETKAGYRNKYCTSCGYGVTENIPALKDTDPSQLNIVLYELRDDGYWVTGIQSCTDPVLKIPSTYEAKPVVGIAEKAFYKNNVLTEVVIPDSVKKCEYKAFANCDKLKKVTLSENMTTIPTGMFYDCAELTQINIPASIKSIETQAFCLCEKLNLGTITLNCSIGYDAFAYVSFDTLTVNGSIAQSGLASTNINKLIISEGLETLEKDVLSRAKVGEISFPTTLRTIKGGAFYGIDTEKLVFNSPVFADYMAFNNGTMKEIVLRSGSTFDKGAFINCNNLETITFAGTRAEWNSIVNKYGQISDLSGVSIVCSDD